MTRLKPVILAILILMTVFTFAACSNTNDVQASQAKILEFTYAHKHSDAFCSIIVDNETGVNYIVTELYDNSVSITPRLNANGSLYISE